MALKVFVLCFLFFFYIMNISCQEMNNGIIMFQIVIYSSTKLKKRHYK